MIPSEYSLQNRLAMHTFKTCFVIHFLVGFDLWTECKSSWENVVIEKGFTPYSFHGIDSFLASRTFAWINCWFTAGLFRCRCILKEVQRRRGGLGLFASGGVLSTYHKSFGDMFDFRCSRFHFHRVLFEFSKTILQRLSLTFGGNNFFVIRILFGYTARAARSIRWCHRFSKFQHHK